MRRPKKPSTPINNKRISGWLGRFSGYRRDVTRSRIDAWIDQFDAADRDLGARVLDCITYVTHGEMEEAFRALASRLNGWDRARSKRRGKWRFVAFSKTTAESGDTMLHKWRSALGLSGGQHGELFIYKSNLLREQLTTEDTVVFVDDFSGTGKQVCGYWHDVMAELLPGRPRAYLVLVAASEAARKKIHSETLLKVESKILLRQDDNIFAPECRHFTASDKDALLRYCSRADNRNPRGYGNCGFVIVLAHKTPNNSIPILHSNHQGWLGLFPRH